MARSWFPLVAFYNELPQWVISSDVAAYHPWSRTIYIRKGLGARTVRVLVHELGHWAIDVLGCPEALHDWLDGKFSPVELSLKGAKANMSNESDLEFVKVARPARPGESPHYSVRLQYDPYVWVIVEIETGSPGHPVGHPRGPAFENTTGALEMLKKLGKDHGSCAPGEHFEGVTPLRPFVSLEFGFSGARVEAGYFAREVWSALGLFSYHGENTLNVIRTSREEHNEALRLGRHTKVVEISTKDKCRS